MVHHLGGTDQRTGEQLVGNEDLAVGTPFVPSLTITFQRLLLVIIPQS